MRRLRGTVLVAILAAVPLAGCDDPPTIIPPDRVEITTTFNGTLTVNGAITHRFTTTSLGQITVTLKALGPPGTPTVALGLGVWTGASCNLLISNDNAGVDARLIGTGNEPGQFCARIFDAGRLTAPATYTLEAVYF